MSLENVIDPDAATESEIKELTPLLVQESGCVMEGPHNYEPNNMLQTLEPTASSVGLKENIEDCLKIPTPSGKYH